MTVDDADRPGGGNARHHAASLPAFVTRREAAEILGCSVDTIDRRIQAGQLKAMSSGRLVRIALSDLKAFIRASRRWR